MAVKPGKHDDLSDYSLLELFRIEVETQAGVLTNGLLELERAPCEPRVLETVMRAAHSIKGAARIVNLNLAVRLAHAMEDCFVSAQQGKLLLDKPGIDLLFRGVDLLAQIPKRTDSTIAGWETESSGHVKGFLDALAKLAPGQMQSSPSAPAAATKEGQGRPTAPSAPTETAVSSPAAHSADAKTPPEPGGSKKADRDDASVEPGMPTATPQAPAISNQSPDRGSGNLADAARPSKDFDQERVLRLTAENLNRLLGLAGESLVESRWLQAFAGSLQRLKRQQIEMAENLDDLRQAIQTDSANERLASRVSRLSHQLAGANGFLAEKLQELDVFDRRSAHLSHRLYLEVLRTRMRPFGDGVRRFPRMVRDLARGLGKEVRLEIVGENTQVDRDILERLETPLAHLLRNAVDHGCETPELRRRAGKPLEAVVRLEARHSAGMLVVTVSDDGVGLAPERIRSAVVQRKLTLPAVAEKMTEAELLEFLFLPGFTLKETVTEISGRGVGLDVVQNMVRGVRGSIRVSTQPGRGLRFQLHLPLTLSVMRTLLVEVAGEPYAFPLSQIARTVRLPRERVESLEGRHHFRMDGMPVGLLAAHQVLDCGEPKAASQELPVVVLSERSTRYGLVVDRFLGQRELVVQPLDPRLGKVKDISAAALMEDGSPVLIVDVEDMVRSIEKLAVGGQLAAFRRGLALTPRKQKRILAVDDSLTVRELERKMLSARGYHADVAVDGMDGWNALRLGHYDLVITDVDMPRMDGIELTSLIKSDPNLKSLPVLIVSYKDREEDRLRGLQAGADYYLTKGSFHDETLLQVVADLIGGPDA